MKICTGLSLLVCLGCLVGVSCWPHGAPASACETLRPSHHDNQPQNTASPYSILVKEPSYIPGEVLAISLVSDGTEPFLGFLLETREVDQTGNYGGYIGELTPTVGTKHVKGCGKATLTHIDAGKTAFTNLTVTWMAPRENPRPFVIRATFIQSFSTFWVGVTSPVITPAREVSADSRVSPTTTVSFQTAIYTTTSDNRGLKSSRITTTSRKTTTSPLSHTSTTNQETLCENVTSQIHTDVECERSKGCFVSCGSYGCDYVVSWESREDVVDFEITARTTGTGDQWVAIGFSYDIEMGDDSVVECVSEMGAVSVFQSFNYVYYNKRLDKPNIGLSLTQGCVKNGIFRCKFSRKKAIPDDEQMKEFDLKKPWIIMFANGEARDGIKKMHALSPRYGPWTSGILVNFNQFQLVGKGAGSLLLISLHGCFMIVAWVICASAGVLAARYYKSEWQNVKPFGQKVWFLIHRTCLVVAFTLVVAGFFIIYEEADRGFGPVKNGYATGKLFEAVHPTLGVVTFAFSFVNPIMAVFRPSPDAEMRPLFNWAHRCVGIFTLVIAFFTIAFGLGMEKVGAPQFSLYIMLGLGVYQIAVAVSLEIWDCLNKDGKDTCSQHERGDYLPDGTAEHQNLISKPRQESEDTWTWKTILFCGNSLILIAVGIFLMILITRNSS